MDLFRLSNPDREIVAAFRDCGSPEVVHIGPPLEMDATLLGDRAVPEGGYDLVERPRPKVEAASTSDSFRLLSDNGIWTATRKGSVFSLGAETPADSKDLRSWSWRPPGRFTEAMTWDGRWAGEMRPVRTVMGGQGLSVENRAGSRSSLGRFPAIVVGEHGFGDDHGEVVLAHLAWCGDWRITLAPDEMGEYRLSAVGRTEALDRTIVQPLIVIAWSDSGLNGLRVDMQDAARLSMPQIEPKVQLNTWEGVYFDHSLSRLTAMAKAGAEIGVERFVLDDGWFGRRTDDTRGLGDWRPRREVYPDGLTPLIDAVEAYDMEFGLWIEPEMASADSALYETYPNWILGPKDQRLFRNQYALNLTEAACFDHVAETLSELLSNPRIVSIKWDMNRDVEDAPPGLAQASLDLQKSVSAGRASTGTPLEIESCASGGGRLDWAWMAGCHRAWISDTHDPDIRLPIMEAASLFLPPTMMGAHVGAKISHQTARAWSLEARACMASLGAFGLELDPTQMSEADRDLVERFIAGWKHRRPWMRGGHMLALPHPDAALTALGVYSAERDRAAICVLQREERRLARPIPLQIKHLVDTNIYGLDVFSADPVIVRAAKKQPDWLTHGLKTTSSALERVGLPLPVLPAGRALLIDIAAEPRDEAL
ncbi:MAG: alpha-galactosidase [Pseudomonadota bacterium]